MIIKASQRGSAAELAVHLLNLRDNDHVELHEISGFIADNLPEALQEAYATSRGSKCTQFLFSVSLNPPRDAVVSTATFEEALKRIEEKMGLEGQPKVVVFHTKENRRHAHAVYSRIDSQTMTAINLPYFKNKLMEISKDLYLENNWKLPQGFVDKERRNPLNFTLEQWQQAKRLEDDPKTIKRDLKECWAVSDDQKSFSASLEARGFYLAKGDRRSFVAVDWRGEVYSLSRWLDVKTKQLKERLGDPALLPTAQETKSGLDQQLVQRVQVFMGEIKHKHQRRLSPLSEQKERIAKRHEEKHMELAMRQDKRQQQELQERQNRFRAGLRGLWDRVTGKHAQIKEQNEEQYYRAYIRDREEKDTLIHTQIDDRSELQSRFDELRKEQQNDIKNLKESLFSKLPNEKIDQLEQEFKKPPPEPEQYFDMEM